MDDRLIDPTNKFMIAKRGADFIFMRPLPQQLSDEDAMLVAAYIVAMCSDRERWKAILQAVCNA